MSAGIDIQMVKDRYRRMSDDELIRIATTDAAGLTPQAIEVVNAEIASRGINSAITRGVAAQNRTYTVSEIDTYCDIISNLACPHCSSTLQRLNAAMTGRVTSFVIVTQYKKAIKVGCPSCLDKANNTALAITLMFGWWGIPWGIVRSIQSIRLNIKSKRTNRLDGHNDYLRGFVLNNIGMLESYKDDLGKLQRLIAG